MNEEHINRFNNARSFLYLSGYLSDSENKNIKKRFKKKADKEGVILECKSLFDKSK